jgi:hypothetical protein
MANITSKIDAAYREYAEKQIRRHFLLIEDKGDGDEADEIEARLAILWEGLDDAQRRSLNGIASDLNWLRRRGAAPPKGRAASEVTEADLCELQATQDAQDWHAILHYLRVCAPAVPQDLLAYSRATCYHKLDFPQIAAAFADLAMELGSGINHVGTLAYDFLKMFTPQAREP